MQENTDWTFKISSEVCKIVSERRIADKEQKDFGDYMEYVFVCSEIDANTWTYAINYNISLSYKNSKIREISDEFFQKHEPLLEGEKLNQKEIQKYKRPSIDDFKNGIFYQNILSDINDEKQKTLFNQAVSSQKNLFILPANKVYEIVDDIDLSESVLFAEEGSRIISWPMVKIKVGALVVLGREPAPVIFTNKTGMPGWYGIEVISGGYIANTEISNTANTKDGALRGENSLLLKTVHTKFTNNNGNIYCDNCVIDISYSNFSGGKWGAKIKNSIFNLDNNNCAGTQYCFAIEDSMGEIQNTSMENLKAWGLKIKGQEADIEIGKIKAKNIPILISKLNYPKISYNENNFDLEDTKITVADFDSQRIYDEAVKMSPNDFAKHYEEYITRDHNDQTKFYLKKNIKIIDKDIIVPENIALEITAGQTIHFTKETSILSYGKIIAKGTAENKITFTNFKDKKDKDKFWGVVALKGDKASGIFDYAIFENGGPDYLTGFEYSGALTADHAKELIITNSIFRNNSGDDAINCKFSLCKIYDNLIEKNAMDGIDFDFADPASEIRGNTFLENGNDAVDLSFSDIKVYENKMISSGDKGMSVGEESHPIIFNNLIKGNNIGIESKDSSIATVINNDFVDNKLDLNAYQKKKRFEVGGTINAFNNIFSGGKNEESKTDYYSEININKEKNMGVYKKYLNFYDLNKLQYGMR